MTESKTFGFAPSWDKAIGKVYTVASLAEKLDVDEIKVAEWASRNKLVALETGSGNLVFPVFQFDLEMKILPGLLQVWKVLKGAEVTDWTRAQWLNSPILGQVSGSIIELLGKKENLKKALFEANKIVRVWMQ